MVQSLELTFDRRADEVLRAQWQALRDAGLPSMARHTGPTNRPHVTVDPATRSSPRPRRPWPPWRCGYRWSLRIGGLLLFHGRRRWVLARHVVVDRPLLELHAHAQAVLGPDSSPLTARGRWVPHLTLARNIQDEQLPEALKIVSAAPPLVATALRLRRWDSEEQRAWDVEPD